MWLQTSALLRCAPVIPSLTPPASSGTLAFGVRRFPVTVRLPPRIERIVEDAVRSGEYRSAETPFLPLQ
jgi:hypothetical protein